MELLRVIANNYGTIIMRPSWQDNVLGLDWEDDTSRGAVDLTGAELYFNHPDSAQSLTKVLPGERVAVWGVDVPTGMYRVVDGNTMVPVALSNWGVARVWIEGNMITAIHRDNHVESDLTRLTGHVLSRAQGSEFLYGAAVAAEQFGTPFVSSVVQLIKDGEYLIAVRNDGFKAWLEIEQ